MFLAGLGGIAQSKLHKGQARGWFSMQISTARAETKLLWRDMCGVEASAVLFFFSLLCAPSPACSKFASEQPQPLSVTNIKPYLGHVRNSVPIAPTDGELPPSYPCQDVFWSVIGTICKGSAAGERGESPGFTDPSRRRGTAVPTEHPGDRGSQPQPLPYPASIVYSRTPRLQMSQPSS